LQAVDTRELTPGVLCRLLIEDVQNLESYCYEKGICKNNTPPDRLAFCVTDQVIGWPIQDHLGPRWQNCEGRRV
jgi:hypothetical protein